MTQPVTLATTPEPREFRLLELPPELDTAISKGIEAPFAIHGRLVDDAALSTEDATYAVRQVTQTNTMLLCSPAVQDDKLVLQMHRSAPEILELAPMAARLDRMPELLAESEYAGESAEGLLTARRYTPREVRSVVQASTREFEAGLREHHVVFLDGYLRRISPEFCFDQLRVLVNQLDILACEPHAVPYSPVVHALEKAGARKEVAQALLEWFGQPFDDVVALDADRIARALGIGKLRHNKKKPLIEFVNEWRELLGALAGNAHLPLLEGFFLLHPPPASFATASVHTARHDPAPGPLRASLTIEYIPHTALSAVPATRFRELFMLRPQWVAQELQPYISPLVAGNVPEKRAAALEKLLLTHARSIRARWSAVHGAVLLRGAEDAARNSEECLVYQARFKT